MIQVASLATRLLGDSTELIQDFVLKQINDDGGFKDRCGDSDIYYCVFGLECLRALKVDPPVDKIDLSSNLLAMARLSTLFT